MNRLVINKLQPDEISEVADILTNAFKTNPAYSIIFPKKNQLEDGLRWLFKTNLFLLNQKQVFTNVVKEEGTGKIIGTFTILPPQGVKTSLSTYSKIGISHLSNAVNPQSPDYMTFNEGTQPLVDAAYLSEGILRAPVQLWKNLDEQTRDNLLIALKQTRTIKPMESNWLLFASMVEATILELTGQCDTIRMIYGVERFRDDFYKGDGVYGDGVPFHNDYYNSYVIHPMLLDILVVMERHYIPGHDFLAVERIRHTRYAKTLERFIAPDGTYPVIGRSIAACRFGAFHSLSQAALLDMLPKEVFPAQVRCGLTAVILRQLERKDNFDSAGWLRVGFTGNQMRIAEPYVNTGSLYHCTTVFLALGLPSSHPFWSSPYTPWTSVRAWNGEEIDWDQPLKD